MSFFFLIFFFCFFLYKGKNIYDQHKTYRLQIVHEININTEQRKVKQNKTTLFNPRVLKVAQEIFIL